MKNLFSIFAAALILLSGMNVAVSNHYCRGEFVSYKVSLTGEIATCEMTKTAICTLHGVNAYSEDCCNDELKNIESKITLNSSVQELDIQKSISSLFVPNFNDAPGTNYYLFSKEKDFRVQEKGFAGDLVPAITCVFRI
jgi:hypothetical protein